jgi:PAS domain-containing protein
MFKSQSQLQTILDHAPMMVYLKDKKGRYLFHNASFRRLLSHSLRDGATVQDIFPPAVAAVSDLKDEEVMATGQSVEFPYEINGNSFLEVIFPIVDHEGNIDAIVPLWMISTISFAVWWKVVN